MPLTSAIMPIQKLRNTVTGFAPKGRNSPQLGWLTFTLPASIVKILTSLTMKKKHKLDKQGTKHCQFLLDMCQTHCNLTSSDVPDIFDINKDQKHILNQLIHFALKNWEAQHTFYCERCCSTIKKKLSLWFVARPLKKVKPSAYSSDYAKGICGKNLKVQAVSSCTVQKNNWLHPDANLFSKYHDKHIGFNFSSGHKIIPANRAVHLNHVPTLPYINNYSIVDCTHCFHNIK